MRNFFRRRPRIVITQLTLDPHEARVISAWGFTEAAWHALDNTARAYFRTNYMKAPRYIK